MANNDKMETMLYNAAMGLGLAEEMRTNPDIFVLGQGVASGGWFGAEKGLADEFGSDRVVDCGICEAFEVGMAAGASVVGMTPVINLGFADFSLIAGDEIYHKLGKWRYMHGLNVPMSAVIILPVGVMGGAGPEHSNSIEVLGMHFPGLKVVVPSNAADAKGLMKAALREPNPVLYHSIQTLSFTRGEVPLDSDYIVEIGKGIVRRPGRDATLLTYGSMVNRSLEAATTLANEGIEVEIIDLRSLVPLDWELILESVNRTHRALVVHEANKTAGPGAEIAAQIQERAFYELETPILRVAGKDVPLPQQNDLEQACIPSVDEIVAAGRHIMSL
ncbi:alpha-ketoacid dehydrogenase subunit beta [Pseudomaricurvus alcaniphilus]|uniref:alpha-ketoacid dehydrogenase subunit beta n=1 Tax=Pseudomaricurvus alcaniphilus TaxID=1166482 RepID=UPI00140CBE75|nr:transketolase C-terminal domain-containing protein [Pseudomaricurvus alcaniphilus]NHN36831.1 alpha-ketoacid dehydrogenase subunit beta [Pseudomaricurvus alcaniphilus]